MTYYLPLDQQRIEVRLAADAQPIDFRWIGGRHAIEFISNCYRVQDGTLEAPIERDYFEIVTIDGWLMLLYHDLISGNWGLELIYD